jgi:hypothetical protein
MKQVTVFKQVFLSICSLLVSALLWAQEKKVDVDINVGKEQQWYAQPWMWVVGGAVFILLLVALLRGGKSKA